MGADLFESYVGSLVAPIAYASLAFAGSALLPQLVMFPLAVAALGMAASIGASFLVARGSGGCGGTTSATRCGWPPSGRPPSPPSVSSRCRGRCSEAWPVLPTLSGLFLAVVVGLVAGLAIGQISEWFTSDHFKVVKEVARNSQTGAATVLISGIAEGMRSSAYSVVLVAGGIVGAFAAGNWAMGDGGGDLRRLDCRHRRARHPRDHDLRRCLRSHCRQRRRDRPDGASATGSPSGDRHPRLARQHDRRRRQRLCDRFRRRHSAGSVRGFRRGGIPRLDQPDQSGRRLPGFSSAARFRFSSRPSP